MVSPLLLVGKGYCYRIMFAQIHDDAHHVDPSFDNLDQLLRQEKVHDTRLLKTNRLPLFFSLKHLRMFVLS